MLCLLEINLLELLEPCMLELHLSLLRKLNLYLFDFFLLELHLLEQPKLKFNLL